MPVGFVIKGKGRDVIVIAETLPEAEKEFKKHKNDIEKFSEGLFFISPTPVKKPEKVSITQLILELKSDKFFDKPKNWNDIQKALEKMGYNYPLRSLTEPLQRLVRKKELGRIKKNKKWHYVKR